MQALLAGLFLVPLLALGTATVAAEDGASAGTPVMLAPALVFALGGVGVILLRRTWLKPPR